MGGLRAVEAVPPAALSCRTAAGARVQAHNVFRNSMIALRSSGRSDLPTLPLVPAGLSLNSCPVLVLPRILVSSRKPLAS